MKNIVVFVFLFFIKSNSNAQFKMDSLQLSIVNYHDTIRNMNDAVIQLNLINGSGYPVVIPGTKLSAGPKNIDPVIYYELIFIDNGGIADTLFKKTMKFDNTPLSPVIYDILYPGATRTVNSHLDDYNFQKIGKYKIRFGFNASRLNKYYQDIKTAWISTYITTPLGY